MYVDEAVDFEGAGLGALVAVGAGQEIVGKEGWEEKVVEGSGPVSMR